MSLTYVAVSVANIFVHWPTADDYGYHDFSKLARFAYCLLQKIKKSCYLAHLEQWAEIVNANHSRFFAMVEEDVLVETHLMTTLNKFGSYILKTDFHRDDCRLLDDFVYCQLSVFAAPLLVGQEIGCFCPAIVVRGDDVALLQIFKNL